MSAWAHGDDERREVRLVVAVAERDAARCRRHGGWGRIPGDTRRPVQDIVSGAGRILG